MALHAILKFAVLLLVVVSSSTPQAQSATEVRYIANAGMLVTVSDRRFLIDAPIRDSIPPYAASSTKERALLEEAQAPYDNVDAILITHWHEDHFDRAAVANHLTRNPRTILITSPEVIDRVRAVAPHLPESQLRGVLPTPGNATQVIVRGVPVHVLRIRHNPTRRPPEQHVGFLIGASTPVLHVGDADPATDNFALLKTLPPVDLAFLPFWYVSDDTNRRLVAESIRPRRIIAMHIPPADAAKVAPTLRATNAPIVLADKPGTRLALVP
jgi:L-ascorbate metabolism protein UlaG (beta-lactamase superfamily)